MSSGFDPKAIQQGNAIRNELKQNPATFASDAGVARTQPNSNLEQGSGGRMAGEVGARALQLMQSPEAAAAADQWMELFGQSNEGTTFNQAKMDQAVQQYSAGHLRDQVKRKGM